jgi:SlyX protein
MDEKRLIDIEIKLAHHEDTIAELNDVLVDQQKQLARLEAVCDTLVAKLGALARLGADSTTNTTGD